MKISRGAAGLLLVPTIYPLIYLLAFFVTFLSERAADGSLPIFGSVENIQRFHLAAMLVGFAVVILYVAHSLRRAEFSSDQRLLWVVLLILGGLFSAPIYWYLFVWRDARRSSGSQPSLSDAS